MSPELDRTDAEDRLDMLGAPSDFLVATEAREAARRRMIRLARRIISDPALTDEEAVPAAYRVSLDFVLAAKAVASG